jgi:hypothetical protein
MFRSLLAALLVLLLSGLLNADEPQPIELSIHPRAIESPPLKYRLLPPETDLKPGNAVPILLRLPWEQTAWMNKEFPKLHEWESRPLSAPEWKTSGGVLPPNFYSEMKRAAFRREAVWEYPLGETASPYMILLPDVQGLRGFLGHGLSARIRYHLTEGELDKAREGILVGLSNSRHLAQTPFFINQLVAAAIERIMLDRMVELIAQKDSPNLYWAVSTLPDSLLSMDRAASLEADLFAMGLPAVNDLDRPRDAKEWRKMAGQLLQLLEELHEIPTLERPKEGASVVEHLLHTLNAAGKSHLTMLVKHARAELPALLQVPKEKVAAMTDEEACIRWYVHERLARDHRTSAVLSLPPREAWPELKRLRGEIASLRQKTGGQGFDFLEPTSLYLTTWSLKRKIQSLRVIEAVRHYLSTHDGKLPESLGQIKDIPVPIDPLTDQPFVWTVEGGSATIKAPPLPEGVLEPGSAAEKTAALEYRLHVK